MPRRILPKVHTDFIETPRYDVIDADANWVVFDNGEIRCVADDPEYSCTVLDLHRMLCDRADDVIKQAFASSNLFDMTRDSPSMRKTDQLITLRGDLFITDKTAKVLYGGTIEQKNGAEIYSAICVLGMMVDNLEPSNIFSIQPELLVFQDTSSLPVYRFNQENLPNANFTNRVLAQFILPTKKNDRLINSGYVSVTSSIANDTFTVQCTGGISHAPVLFTV